MLHPYNHMGQGDNGGEVFDTVIHVYIITSLTIYMKAHINDNKYPKTQSNIIRRTS